MSTLTSSYSTHLPSICSSSTVPPLSFSNSIPGRILRPSACSMVILTSSPLASSSIKSPTTDVDVVLDQLLGELENKCVCIGEIGGLHGRNLLSRNAVMTVSPSGNSTTLR